MLANGLIEGCEVVWVPSALKSRFGKKSPRVGKLCRDEFSTMKMLHEKQITQYMHARGNGSWDDRQSMIAKSFLIHFAGAAVRDVVATGSADFLTINETDGEYEVHLVTLRAFGPKVSHGGKPRREIIAASQAPVQGPNILQRILGQSAQGQRYSDSELSEWFLMYRTF